LTVKKSSDKFEVSQESNGSLRRWTTLTKLDLKLSGSKSTLQSDAGKDLHVVDEQERKDKMVKRMGTFFEKKEQGRIREILSKKYNLFQQEPSSTKSINSLKTPEVLQRTISSSTPDQSVIHGLVSKLK